MAGNDFWGNWVTPDLARNPGLATDAINSKQPNVVAPMLSLAAKGGAVSDAINDNTESRQNCFPVTIEVRWRYFCSIGLIKKLF